MLFLGLQLEIIAKTLHRNVYGQDLEEVEHLQQLVRQFQLPLLEVMAQICGEEVSIPLIIQMINIG